jgi:ribosomal protein L11 methyltransferase
MTDYVLEIAFPSELDEVVQGRLFLTRSTGSASMLPGVLTAYFDSAADRDAAAEALRDLPLAVTSDERPRTDWLQLYQQSLQPMFVGRAFVIAPEAGLIPAGSRRHALVIPQEQAFGTGSHESTVLCIELLEDIDLRGRRVLDVGSGTGILALAMLRMGARKAIAFDNDLDAFRPMRENRARNAGAALSVFIGTIAALRGGRFDVITMNILPEVIVPLLPEVKRHLGGTLILSGILHVQRDYVADACERQGLRPVDEKIRGEWWAATFTA